MKPAEPLTGLTERDTSSGGMDENDPLYPLYKLIAKLPFFAGLPSRHLRSLTESAVLIPVESERYLYYQGTPANRFYLILEGKVQLEMESATREGSLIPIRTLGPGDDLGWDWLFPPFEFHATARAVEPTRTISFYGTRLYQQCEEDHDLGYEIMKRIAAVTVQSFSVIQQKLVECDNAKDRI